MQGEGRSRLDHDTTTEVSWLARLLEVSEMSRQQPVVLFHGVTCLPYGKSLQRSLFCFAYCLPLTPSIAGISLGIAQPACAVNSDHVLYYRSVNSLQ